MESVTVKQAYEWVKTGHWNLRQFEAWFDYQALEYYTQGFNKGERFSEIESESNKGPRDD